MKKISNIAAWLSLSALVLYWPALAFLIFGLAAVSPLGQGAA